VINANQPPPHPPFVKGGTGGILKPASSWLSLQTAPYSTTIALATAVGGATTARVGSRTKNPSGDRGGSFTAGWLESTGAVWEGGRWSVPFLATRYVLLGILFSPFHPSYCSPFACRVRYICGVLTIYGLSQNVYLFQLNDYSCLCTLHCRKNTFLFRLRSIHKVHLGQLFSYSTRK